MLKSIKDFLQGKTTLTKKRSPKWPRVREKYIKKFPNCAVCNGDKNVEVHHKKPFHLFPDLELDENNLISLCESKQNGVTCHLFIGHLGNYKSYNPDVDVDSAYWRKKLEDAKRSLGQNIDPRKIFPTSGSIK